MVSNFYGLLELETRMMIFFFFYKSKLFIELVLGFVFLDVVLIALFKIFGQDYVPILSHGLHASFLTYGVDVSTANAIRACNVVLGRTKKGI